MPFRSLFGGSDEPDDAGDPFAGLGTEPEPPPAASPSPEPASAPDQLQRVMRRVEELEGRLASLQERFDAPSPEPDLAPLEARLSTALRLRDAELERLREMVAAVVTSPTLESALEPVIEPAASSAGNHFTEPAAHIHRVLEGLMADAPDRLRRSLESATTEATGLLRRLAVSSSGELELHLSLEGSAREVAAELQRQVLEEASARSAPESERTAAFERLATTLVPEIIELCENSRRSQDTGELFYETLDERIEELMEACELEPIAPEPGEAYQNSLHNAVRVVRTPDASRRDTVDVCLGRGFRWRGRLLRKAEVTVYL